MQTLTSSISPITTVRPAPFLPGHYSMQALSFDDTYPMASLTEGLNRLRENVVQLARSDAREVISRFGQQGTRRLAAVS